MLIANIIIYDNTHSIFIDSYTASIYNDRETSQNKENVTNKFVELGNNLAEDLKSGKNLICNGTTLYHPFPFYRKTLNQKNIKYIDVFPSSESEKEEKICNDILENDKLNNKVCYACSDEELQQESPYCEECNSCGESMCCAETKCKHLKTYIVEYCKSKFIELISDDYKKALEDLMNHVKA